MTYAQVPHFDKPISKLVMGVIPLNTQDHASAFEVLDAYRAVGGNIIDNSFIYGDGYLGLMRAYYEARGEDALIRFDKGNHPHGTTRRITKEDMDHDIRGNLEKQGVSYSDFYVLHRDDPSVPVGNIVEWLNEHKEAGRIRAFGGSNWHHTRVEAANEYAEKHGIQGFSVSSPNFSLAKPNEPMWWEAYSVDREARDWYEKSGFPLFSWSSAGGGFFVGYESDDIKRVYDNEVNWARKARLEEMAAQKNVSASQLALAWAMNQPMNIWCLIGPRTAEMVADNAKAVDIKLTQAELDWVENGG